MWVQRTSSDLTMLNTEAIACPPPPSSEAIESGFSCGKFQSREVHLRSSRVPWHTLGVGPQLKGLIQLPFRSPAPTGLDLTPPGLVPSVLSSQKFRACISRAEEVPTADLRGNQGSLWTGPCPQSTLRKGCGLRGAQLGPCARSKVKPPSGFRFQIYATFYHFNRTLLLGEPHNQITTRAPPSLTACI